VLEASGLVFVQPTDVVRRAAPLARATVGNAEGVHEVFVDRSGSTQVATDLLTVKVDPQLSPEAAQQRLADDGLRVVRRITFAPNTYEVHPVNQYPLREIVARLQEQRAYVYAEPNLLGVLSGRALPNDPSFKRQWQLRNTGSGGGTANADIHALQAWELTRGVGPNRPVRIAVIDNGMQVSHPDLKDGIVGGGHFASQAGGSAEFIPYEAGDPDFPDGNHGTFCMGMAGARMNNHRGVCGSAPECHLLAIACLNDQVGTQTTLARAVAFAADPSGENPDLTAADGADVIVSSLGPNGADWDLTSVLDEAIRFATTNGRGGVGTPIFWAVSNGFVELARDEVSSHPNVIGVGRSTRNDLDDGSAFGDRLAFLAPGVDVFSTMSNGRYDKWTGTSFAAPLAAGVGALVLSRFPDLTPQQLRDRLLNACDKIGNVQYDANRHHKDYGFGRINAARAVQ